MNRKILIIQSGFLGDAVLAGGMLRALQSIAPDVPVGLVVRSEFADLFRNRPVPVALHPFEKRTRGGTARLIGEIRQKGYDTALIPHRSLRSALVAYRAGIRCRIGFRQSQGALLLTDRVEYRITDHETDRNAALVGELGIVPSADVRLPQLFPSEAAVDSIRARLRLDPAPVVIAPGSVWPTKRWTVAGYARVAERLTEEGAAVLLVGAGAEREVCSAIADRAGLSAGAVLAGTLSLPELLALISMAKQVITNDSAPLHLAESLGVPVTALFGPTVPEFGFGPRSAASSVVEVGDMPCRPCGIHGAPRCPLGTHACMERISAADVLRALDR